MGVHVLPLIIVWHRNKHLNSTTVLSCCEEWETVQLITYLLCYTWNFESDLIDY